MSLSPAVILYDAAGVAMAVQDGVAIPASTRSLLVSGSDGTNSRVLKTDANGALQVVTAVAAGTFLTILSQGTLATNTTVFTEYVVPVGKTIKLTNFYTGGVALQGTTGSLRSALFGHDETLASTILNGDFENSGQITPWAAVTGTFTAPSPDSSSVQFQTGAASMRWIYTNSATALQRRQTFATPLNTSGYRFIRVKFFNDAATATSRTISIILTSGANTRTYSIGPIALGTAPFTTNTWVTLLADIEVPTTSAGASFDPYSVNSIDLKMQDAANKAGTVYWDSLQFVDPLEPKHRLFSADGSTVSVPISPELFPAGFKLYIRTKNTANGTIEYSSVVNALLEDE